MSISSITPQQLQAIRSQGQDILVIDVRTPAEFQEVHVDCAQNIPLDKLDVSTLCQQHADSAQPIYLICRSGSRGKQACEKFLAHGFNKIKNVEGGTLAWDQAGLPVVRGKKMMSLERQVRIAAGTLVVIGAALGFFVHPYWIGLSAFIGAGLVFAGITDTCGMGMMIAKMPWNQVASSAPQQACATK